tara:strand:+ start:537 stop:950 length:414 start_codon:yes stop_codon:yes gene_type:complete
MAFKMKGFPKHKGIKSEKKLKDLRSNDKNIDLDKGENMPVKRSGFGPSTAFGGVKNPELTKGGAPKKGLWDNIHAKRKRGETMRKPGDAGAPTDKALKESQTKSGAPKKGPCWEGYEMIGMKKKGGRTVPNCVPKNK